MATKKFKCEVCGYIHEGDAAPAKCPVCGATADKFTEITEGGDAAPKKKKGLDTNSNAYTIVYAAVLVVIVAFLLAFVSSSLKGVQDKNVENDTKSQILAALCYDKATVDVDETFKSVKDMLWQDGQLVDYTGAFRSSYGTAIANGELHVFVADTKDGVKYVLPMTGRGLWGGLWGYIALDEDKQTVYGSYFYHESETAGLGARIGETDFQKLFQGKKVFAEGSDEIALTVVKSGAVKQPEVEVDGITGATLTSNGVAKMVQSGLGMYKDFILGGQSATTGAEQTACCGAAECPNAEGCPCDAAACDSVACDTAACPMAACPMADCPKEDCPKGGCSKAGNCPKAIGCPKAECPNKQNTNN